MFIAIFTNTVLSSTFSIRVINTGQTVIYTTIMTSFTGTLTWGTLSSTVYIANTALITRSTITTIFTVGNTGLTLAIIGISVLSNRTGNHYMFIKNVYIFFNNFIFNYVDIVHQALLRIQLYRYSFMKHCFC